MCEAACRFSLHLHFIVNALLIFHVNPDKAFLFSCFTNHVLNIGKANVFFYE